MAEACLPDVGVLTDELIAAWVAWDRACTPGPKHPSARTLEAEARRLKAAEAALGTPLGYTARIAALRWHPDGRPHLSVPDAVQSVVHELYHQPTIEDPETPADG